MFTYFFAAFIFAVAASAIAYNRGRNSLGWFVSGLFIGPFALIVATLPRVPREGQFVRCESCAEVIRAEANLCRFCGHARQQVPARVGLVSESERRHAS